MVRGRLSEVGSRISWVRWVWLDPSCLVMIENIIVKAIYTTTENTVAYFFIFFQKLNNKVTFGRKSTLGNRHINMDKDMY